MLKEFFSELSQKTGWCFTVIGGGPCPEEDGEIRTIWYVLLLSEDQGHKGNRTPLVITMDRRKSSTILGR